MSEQEQETQAIIPIAGTERGLQVNSLDEMRRWALYVVDSGLAPDCFKTESQVIVATQYGRELGLSLMQGLRSIAVINGRPLLWGDAMLAIVKSSGLLKKYEETVMGKGDDMVALVRSVRLDPNGMETLVETEFTAQDAKDAKLWDKTGPWQTHKKRLMKYKARSFNLRDNFPDVLMGMHSVEEMEGEEVEQLPAPTCETPKRADRKPAADVTVTDTPQTPEQEIVDTPASQDAPEQSETAPADAAEPVDDKTLKTMYAGIYNTFTDLISEVNPKLSLGKFERLFVEFATFTLVLDKKDLPGDDGWTIPLLQTLNAELKNGLPDAIREMIPVEATRAEEKENE